MKPPEPLENTPIFHGKALWTVLERYRICMASQTFVREKLRTKHRARQENIAALVGRWIDGHSRFCWCPFFYAQNQVQKGGQAGSPVPWQAALETGSGPNPERPFYSFYSTINCGEFPVSSGDSPRFCCAQNRWDPPWFHWGGSYSSSSEASPPSPVCICRWGLGKALCDPKERKEMPENGKTMQLIRARLEALLAA